MPKYYLCGACAQYHAASWGGDCRDDASRYNVEELDETYGWDGWREIKNGGRE